MKLGITGHRPLGLFGTYDVDDIVLTNFKKHISNKLLELEPEKIISGMALGTDQIVAEVAVDMGVPFIAAVPCNDQDCMWPDESKKKYQKLLSLAKEVVVVSPGPYGYVEINGKKVNKMHIRDKWIVDNSDELLAVWNGHRQSGTFATIRMGEKKIARGEMYKIHRITP